MDRALETLVALAGLYLFLSLIAMAVVEGVSSLMHLRANHLKKGFDALLEGDAAKVLDHPLVKSLGRAAGRRGDIASYVPREIFSAATMDLISTSRHVAAIPGVKATALQKIAELSGHDPVVLKSRIESWFDAGMERVSGRFKRSIRNVTYGAAALLVIALNVDTSAIGGHLWRDQATREAALEYSKKLLELCKPGEGGKVECPTVPESGAEVAAAFPIGWTSETLRATFGNAAAVLAKLLGLFITFLAVCLGAPFWFDVLRRVAPGLRQSGNKPGEKPKQPPGQEPTAPATV
jgi:hypothetical protein